MARAAMAEAVYRLKTNYASITEDRFVSEPQALFPNDDMEHAELAKASADFFRKEADAPAEGSATDDWMFKSGGDVTGEEPTDRRAMATTDTSSSVTGETSE